MSVASFRRPDPGWEAGVHALGRGCFDAANVGHGAGGLTLALPAGRTDGAELRSRRLQGDGVSAARLRSAGVPGSISAFFLYLHDAGTDTSDELDVEIPGDAPHRVLLTVWRRGEREPVAQRVAAVGFDPAGAFHDYEIERAGARVAFRIDGVQVFACDDAPAGPLRPMFNAWYPTWMTPPDPPAAGALSVSRHAFSPTRRRGARPRRRQAPTAAARASAALRPAAPSAPGSARSTDDAANA